MSVTSRNRSGSSIACLISQKPMSAARTAPTTQRMIWETGTRRSKEGRDAVSAVATGGGYDGNERAGQDRPSRVLGFFSSALPDLLGLDELPRRATCLRLEDRDEAARR